MMSAMTARATVTAPRLARAGAVMGAATLVGAVLAGCAWRVDTAPVERRTPSAEILVRDAAAEREQAVIEAAAAVQEADAPGSQATTLAQVQGQTAPVRLDTLGGVYVATPSPSPSPLEGDGEAKEGAAGEVSGSGAGAVAGQSGPEPSGSEQSGAAVDPALALTAAVEAARDGALAAAGLTPATGAAAPSPTGEVGADGDSDASANGGASGVVAELVPLMRSIALSHALSLAATQDAATQDAADQDNTAPDATQDAAVTLPGVADWPVAVTPASSTSVPTATLAALALAHDRAAFAYEVCAARAGGSDSSAEGSSAGGSSADGSSADGSGADGAEDSAAEDGGVGEREAALARAAQHRQRAAEIIAMGAPRVEDLRAALYVVDPAAVTTVEDRASLEASIESALGATYAALLADAESPDAHWLFNAAYDAYASALTGAAPINLPALPGITPVEADTTQ